MKQQDTQRQTQRRGLVILLLWLLLTMTTATAQVTNLDDAGAGSLRAVIAAAADDATITFQAGLSGTINLTGQIDITQNDLTIDATGATITIDGQDNSRIFNHTGTGTLTVNNLTIQNGYVAGYGGGIASQGAVTVTNSTISGNTADADVAPLMFGGIPIPGDGGGIYSQGAVTVTDSTISGNTAEGDSTGGGIFSNGAVTVTDSTISGNTAEGIGSGGGIASQGAITVTDSAISGNSAGDGGGIRGLNDLTLNGCTTIESNTATGAGDQWNVTGTVTDGTTLATSRDTPYSGPTCGTPQTITFTALPNRTYGDTFTVNATADSGLAVTFTSATAGVCTTSGTNGETITLIATGTCTINADQAGGESGGVTYAAAPQEQQGFDVDKKDLTATVTAANRAYGAANPTFAVTYTGLVGTDSAADITQPPGLATTADATTNAGTAVITCNVGDFVDDNYTLSSCTEGTLTIEQVEVAVTANDVTITEGDTPTFTATYTGFVGTEDESVLTTAVSFADNAPDYNTAGGYIITPSGAAADNYTFTYNTGTLTIQSAGFDVTESGGNTAVTEGAGADPIEVVLTSIPTANVVITVTPDGQLDVGAGAGTADTLTFTPANWDTAQTINVTANDDTDVEGNHEGTLSFTVASGDADYDGATLADITVAITDDEPGVIITPTDPAATEGATTSYDMSLNTNPASAITITVTPDAQTDVGAGAGTAVDLTFNDTTPQTVNVLAVDDTDIEGAHTSTISHAITTGDGGDYPTTFMIDDVTVAITDNDSGGGGGSVINPDPDMQIRAGTTTAAASITSGSVVNIGAFNRGEVATVDFLVRNPGAKVLEIGELGLPSFLSVAGEPLPETLASFGSALLTLSVDTSAAGELAGEFSLASNDPDANENPFVFTVKGSVSDTPANVLNILPGIDLGDISAATGEDNVVLLSFKLSVPAGSTSVTVDSLTLAASNAGIERASNLKLYIDGGTRGELDNRDVFLASTDDTEALTFSFPARTFSPNVPMWFIVVGDF